MTLSTYLLKMTNKKPMIDTSSLANVCFLHFIRREYICHMKANLDLGMDATQS